MQSTKIKDSKTLEWIRSSADKPSPTYSSHTPTSNHSLIALLARDAGTLQKSSLQMAYQYPTLAPLKPVFCALRPASTRIGQYIVRSCRHIRWHLCCWTIIGRRLALQSKRCAKATETVLLRLLNLSTNLWAIYGRGGLPHYRCGSPRPMYTITMTKFTTVSLDYWARSRQTTTSCKYYCNRHKRLGTFAISLQRNA